MPAARQTEDEPAARRKRHLPGITREDSDDELGQEDLPWQWLYTDDREASQADDEAVPTKRRKMSNRKIIGARMGTFDCHVGDVVLLKADGSNEAWVAIICEFVEDDGEGEKAANFMWFSSEKEIRNKERKKTDFFWVRLNPTASSC